MEKFIPENLDEWISSHTGIEGYSNEIPYREEGEDDIAVSDLSDNDLLDLVPPEDFRFTPSKFEDYVDSLISVIPENPEIILKVFSKTLEDHSYLTRKPIGFKSNNPFEPYIHKFIQAVNNILK